jgi:DNA invertase Pin-like site-specific DNA recombinase
MVRTEQKSGTNLEVRPELKTILDFIHPGETLVVTRIDRLARSLRDLQTIVTHLKSKGAHLAATEQPVDTSTATGKAFFDMLGVFAEFETNLRRERQAEGIATAKQRGVYRGRKPKIDREAIQAKLIDGCSPTAIAREMGISRGTVYKAKAQMVSVHSDHNGNGVAAS